MKIFKYLILAVLIISLTKKMHVLHDPIICDQGLVFYNPETKIAIRQTDENSKEQFVGVIAVNPTVTPPTISVPALQFIATIPAKTQKSGLAYGQSNKINLFGFQVQGTALPIVNLTNAQNIGFYWTNEQIATTTNGSIFVSVIAHADTPNQGLSAVGPVWTWYDTPAMRKKLKKYGISIKQSNFKTLVQYIGFCIDNEMAYKLYGVLFNPEQETEKPANLALIVKKEHDPIPH